MLNSNYFDEIFDFMNNLIEENDLKVTAYTLLLDWNNNQSYVVVCFENNNDYFIDYYVAYPIPYDLLTVSVSFFSLFFSVNPSFLVDNGISCSNFILWEELTKNDEIQQQIDNYLLDKAENAY